MPLAKGKSQDIISRNIAELTRANRNKSGEKKRSRAQIARIAYEVARKS